VPVTGGNNRFDIDNVLPKIGNRVIQRCHYKYFCYVKDGEFI